MARRVLALLLLTFPSACGDDGAPPGGGDAAADGAVDGRVDAPPASDARGDARVDATAADAGLDAAEGCAALADGDACPGSTDPNGAERCLGGQCVGTYVAPSPAGNPANPGTRALPKPTIAAALALAVALPGQDTVYVGKNPGAGPALYYDTFFWPAGTHLSGGWLRAADGTWSRDVAANETRLVPVSGTPIRIIDATATAANLQISGMSVRAPSDVSAAIAVSAGAPLLDRMTVEGPDGVSVSRGVQVSGAATIQDSTIRGGIGVTNSFGIFCMGCAGLRVTGSTVTADFGALSIGVYLTGAVAGVRIEGSTITGGPAAPTEDRVGLQAESCSGVTAGLEPRVVGTPIAGVFGSGDTMSGVVVNDCQLVVEDAPYVAGMVTSGAAMGNSAIGVLCQGATSRCDLVRAAVVAGVLPMGGTSEPALAVSAAGASFAGSGSIVGPTAVRGGRAPAATGLNVGQTSPPGTARQLTVSRAVIDAGSCVTATSLTNGVRVAGPARLENSVIEGGVCPGASYGLILDNLAAGEVVEVVNDHITGEGDPLGSSVGVQLQDPGGRFLNNTILAGAGGSRRVFVEIGAAADPEMLHHNVLFGASTLYFDEGSAALTDVALVNMLANASNNLSADPLVDALFKLAATSPNRAAGAASVGGVAAPGVDRDGEARPQPAATAPDIGPDERD